MCPACQKLRDDGYVALVGADKLKSSGSELGEVWRTGRIVHLRASVFSDVFDAEVPEQGMVFADDETLDQLEAAANRTEQQDDAEEGGDHG